MAKKPLKACNHPGCPNLTSGPKCEEHTKQTRKRYDKSRQSASERGYDHQWHKTRESKANQDPLCERCLKVGKVKPLDIVHHIKPVGTHPELRLVMGNLESLCLDCHDLEHKDDRWGKG